MVQMLANGMFEEITYFYIDEETKAGFIIDPGAPAPMVIQKVRENGWHIEKILLTHGHIDHICSALAIKEAIGAEIVIHQQGEQYLKNPNWNLSAGFGELLSFNADHYVQDQEVISLKDKPSFNVRVIYAPGHTADGVAYYAEAENMAFVGDIIFKSSVGRSDLPGGNNSQLLKAIKERIFTLPGKTILYPGHGESTTVQYEKETNPVFNLYD